MHTRRERPVVGGFEHREFDARRPRIDDEDGFMHARLPVRVEGLGLPTQTSSRGNRANRSVSEPSLALTTLETTLLDRVMPDAKLTGYLIKVARPGGYVARASDPPPGNTVM